MEAVKRQSQALFCGVQWQRLQIKTQNSICTQEKNKLLYTSHTGIGCPEIFYRVSHLGEVQNPARHDFGQPVVVTILWPGGWTRWYSVEPFCDPMNMKVS